MLRFKFPFQRHKLNAPSLYLSSHGLSYRDREG